MHSFGIHVADSCTSLIAAFHGPSSLKVCREHELLALPALRVLSKVGEVSEVMPLRELKPLSFGQSETRDAGDARDAQDSGGARNAGTPGTLRTARDVKDAQDDVPERECKRIMREILEAVDHIHSRGLIHRDIKPENIMFHDTSNEPNSPKTQAAKKAVKLIDFDTCLEYEPQSPRAKHVVGTLGYLAPEALQGEYSPASDLWSVGVILYILMTGDMPFEQDMFGEQLRDTRCGSATMNSIYYKLKNANIDFECEPWPSFPQARDLCQQLLAFQPEDRSPSARAALNHPWLSGK
ncbi:unnamed protein product [Effrenium voratum]|uniref:Protein kinase domain-containing protein n=1 Tax=Effrenium voratum TaxID=2562239 RepID=A0AA36IKR5_9DINO|nr:unnamed protein product [Effrenium voratum]CAJ1389424.1 unnamed protein product [Effrenium voratum]